DMEPEGKENKDVRRKKVENDTNIEGLVQCNILEQKRKDKITSSTDRQTELLQTVNKRGVSISNRIRQSQNTSIKDRIKGWNNDSKQNSNQRVEMVDKRMGNNHPESLINKIITCMITTDASPRGRGAALIYENQTELIQHDCWSEKEAEMTSNAKEIKAIYYGLLRFEQ
ncbi:MAG: hypothetical protein EZS28_056467, partial [Streblomastix strix]